MGAAVLGREAETKVWPVTLLVVQSFEPDDGGFKVAVLLLLFLQAFTLAVRTTRLAGEPCPQCGHWLNACGSFEDAAPQAGDYTVCVNCAAVLRFDPLMRLRLVADDDPVRRSAEVLRVVRMVTLAMSEYAACANSPKPSKHKC